MKELKNLGKKSEFTYDPHKVNLDSVKNPHQNLDYIIRLSSPEFTSICPITKQPDFGIIIVDYIPKNLIVESKSFKLFLHSFRNYGAFHEDCTIFIAKKIIKSIKPKWLRIGGYWNPRGGIPIDVFFQTGKLPNDLWVQEHNIQTYRGRL